MVKIQKIVFTFLAFVLVTGVFAQTKKKTNTKKKPKVTVQTPADAPAKVTEKVVTPEVVQTPTSVPLAEREQIVIPPQPVETPKANKTAINGAAEKVIFDSLSVHPIDPSNILYRITNWRRMDLKEKINQPFFSKNTEITKFLLDGVKSGVLTAYTNDSVNTVLSLEGLSKNLQMEDTGSDGLSEEEKAAGFGTDVGGDDGWGNSKPSSTTPKGTKPATGPGTDDGWGNITPSPKTTAGTTAAPAGASTIGTPAVTAALEYFARDLTILEIKEDYIFDKQRSRAYNSIQAITIVIPAEKTVRGFNVPVASFRYKDLDQYFRSNPKCIWYNFKNTAQHKNMADAFDLRLFSARIIKQSNPSDSFLVDLYKGEKGGLRASEQLEYKLMEFEHNLWEY